nr:LysR family transcriptional regulator [Rhizobium tubonense]
MRRFRPDPASPHEYRISGIERGYRTASFTLAAKELAVSPAAISQQVKNLEQWLGKQLFTRTGNEITATDAGQAIYSQISKAFRILRICLVCQKVREAEDKLSAGGHLDVHYMAGRRGTYRGSGSGTGNVAAIEGLIANRQFACSIGARTGDIIALPYATVRSMRFGARTSFSI